MSVYSLRSSFALIFPDRLKSQHLVVCTEWAVGSTGSILLWAAAGGVHRQGKVRHLCNWLRGSMVPNIKQVFLTLARITAEWLLPIDVLVV